MLTGKFAVTLLGIAATIALSSCAITSPATQTGIVSVTGSSSEDYLKSIYSRLGAAGGNVYTLNPKASSVRVYAFRAGQAARMGHNHVLSAPRFTGFVYLPSSGASNGRFDLEFRLDQLEIDNPEYRTALGSAFSSILNPDAIADTRNHMLGANNLQADQFPFVRIHSLEITGEAPKFAVKVQLEMHGQQREIWVPLNIDGLPDHLSASGSFVLRQTDFGVRPYSALGGLIAIRDEVVIEFKLIGT